jgi:hypothetical protein
MLFYCKEMTVIEVKYGETEVNSLLLGLFNSKTSIVLELLNQLTFN